MKPLTEAVKQFMYTHMRSTPYTKELIKTIETVEDQYIARIAELEKQVQEKAEPETGGRHEEYPDRDWHNFD